MTEQTSAVSAEPAPITASIDIPPYEAVVLTTERLTLRPMTLSEASEQHSQFKSARSIVRYLRWEVRDHDHDDNKNGIGKRLAAGSIARTGDGLVFAVELTDPDGGHGREIGDISVFLKSRRNAQVEIGWVFHPAIHGRGFATEATTAAIDLCFNELGAHRVFAELDTRNEASARLCGILGMRQEALMKDRELVDDEWHDMAIYAVTEPEWRAHQA